MVNTLVGCPFEMLKVKKNTATLPKVTLVSFFALCSFSPLSMASHQEDKAQDETVYVQATQNNALFIHQSSGGTKSDMPLNKVPQAVSVVTKQQIMDQAATSVADALSYSSGVVNRYRGSSNRNDEVISRGFRYTPKYLDGLNFGSGLTSSSSGQIDPWLLEQVELVHGPASVLYGQVSPGGVLIMRSKLPTVKPIHTVQLRGGNRDLGEIAIDVGGQLNPSANLLYRFNGLISHAKQFVEHEKTERYVIAPAFTWIANEDTLFTLLSFYQNDPKAGYRNFLPRYGTVEPSPISGHIPYQMDISDPNFKKSKREEKSIGYLFDHTFNDRWSFHQGLRYLKMDEHYQYLVYTVRHPSAGDSVIKRRPQDENNRSQQFTLDNQLKASFTLGNVQHEMINGIDYRYFKSHNSLARIDGMDFDFDWLHPVWGVTIPYDKFHTTSDDEAKLGQIGLYWQDQLSLHHWELLLSGRYDWAKTQQRDNTLRQPRNMTQQDHAFTGRAGLLYAFANGFSPYISYSTSFMPNLDHAKSDQAAFKPSKGKQQELGFKFQPNETQTLFTLALYHLTETNISSRDPNTFEWYQTGEIASQGIETELHTSISPALDLIANYTYTKAQTKRSLKQAEEHQRLPAIPTHMASLWSEYHFQQSQLRGLTLAAGFHYNGSSPGDKQHRFSVPGYTLFDAMVRYQLSHISPSLKNSQLQLNIKNLTDKHYVASCSGDDACFYGTGRSVIATFNYNW